MKNTLIKITILFVMAFAFFYLIQPAQAGPSLKEDVVAHGKYIATIAGCTSCHTNLRPEFLDFKSLSLDQIQLIAFSENQAQDASKFMAGGRVFDLGPAGIVMSANITPDKKTGIGNWTDAQIKTAITTGQIPSGEILFPVMPYHTFNRMADADLDAVIAYLRTIAPVENAVPPATVSKERLSAVPYQGGIAAPDASDKAARGAYLVNSVMACTDCHTPLEPTTGAPIMEKYLGGGQPYEGPWGIVYGGNITPDPETGIGDWTEVEIQRSLTAGVRKDGRRLILMPWYAYSALTPEDADAIAYYIKNALPAVSNQVPAASLHADFIVNAPEAQDGMSGLPLSVILSGAVVLVIILIAAIALMRKRSAQA
jgi:mono/diheme cytochrome c family protein